MVLGCPGELFDELRAFICHVLPVTLWYSQHRRRRRRHRRGRRRCGRCRRRPSPPAPPLLLLALMLLLLLCPLGHARQVLLAPAVARLTLAFRHSLNSSPQRRLAREGAASLALASGIHWIPYPSSPLPVRGLQAWPWLRSFTRPRPSSSLPAGGLHMAADWA